MQASDIQLPDEVTAILDALEPAHTRFGQRNPGGPWTRQPVHTVYGGAHLFKRDIALRLGARAIESLDGYAPEPFSFARALGIVSKSALPTKKEAARILEELSRGGGAAEHPPEARLIVQIYHRVRQKLAREPVEDFRIDFEDGFGPRSDGEEDAIAESAAQELAHGMALGVLPPFIGIRIKALDARSKRRAARTLELFMNELLERTEGRLPPWFVVTLPKVALPEEVWALRQLLARIEQRFGLEHRPLRMEIMVERTATFFDPEGRFLLPQLLDASEGRCVGVHFGSYDLSASAGVTARHQTMDHPLCQLALGLMKLGYASRGIFLSDGATNVLPIPPHRPGDTGLLTKKHLSDNRRAVRKAWALSYRNIRRSLASGFYQGWDLHPAQLPVRYAASYAFFLEELDEASRRLCRFLDAAARATLTGSVFDDAATGHGLLNFFARALGCGAIDEVELTRLDLTVQEVQAGSFERIVERRTRNR